MTNLNREPLAGQCAVVTGSSGGIGRAVALELARTGADVVVHGCRHAEAAEEVAQAIRQLGREAWVLLADLSKPEGQDKLVLNACGDRTVDIWINNAGADVLTGEAGQWSFDEKLQRLWQIDVVGTIRLSRAVGQKMLARGSGVILNIGWDQAETGMEGDSGEMFAAAKGAVMAFTRSLAKSLAPTVRVNCLAPGWIRTAWGDTASDQWQERVKRESLLHRWGTPEEVARVARFLVSPESSYINGQVIPVNGGFAGPSPS